jgi:hypothetical protein
MSIRLECNVDNIKEADKHLRVALPKSKKERAKAILEMNFKPQEVQLSVIGAMYRLRITSGCYVKVLLPFVFFDTIVKDWKGEVFAASFDNGVISFGGSSLESDAIKIVHPENQPKIDLPINYSDLDLLRSELQYSFEELKRMNLISKIDKARENLDEAIRITLSHLSVYGFKYDDIEKLVMDKIGNIKK